MTKTTAPATFGYTVIGPVLHIDIVTRIAAVRLRSRRSLKILEEHVNHCVARMKR